MTAAQLVAVIGQTLQAEDALLWRMATHINLTMDARRTVPHVPSSSLHCRLHEYQRCYAGLACACQAGDTICRPGGPANKDDECCTFERKHMVVVRCRLEITDLPPEACAEDDAGASEHLRGPSARRQVEASISVRLAPCDPQNAQASDLAPLVRGCSKRVS